MLSMDVEVDVDVDVADVAVAAVAAVIFIFACKQQSLQGSHSPGGPEKGGIYSGDIHNARPKTMSNINILHSKLSRGAKNPNNIDEQTSLAVNELCL